MYEIERKFLVASNEWMLDATGGTAIAQGYLNDDPDRTVRVRCTSDTSGENAYITVKSRRIGNVCFEFEYPIPHNHAVIMLKNMTTSTIYKKRYTVNHNGRRWEVDVFEGANEGLVLAEIELEYVDEGVALPEWVGKEVSDDPRYANSTLAKNPVNTDSGYAYV